MHQLPSQATKPAIWPTLFYYSLIIPNIFFIGDLRVSVYRIVLMMTIVPCIYLWLTGRAGRIRSFDIYFMLFVSWSAISLFVIEGFENGLQPAGMFIIESVGSYLLARCYIRDKESFRKFAKTLVIIVAILLPFAIAESLLHRPVYLNLFGIFSRVPPAAYMEYRFDLTRAQVAFEHPIHFGMFVSSAFSLGYYAFSSGRKGLQTFSVPAIVYLATFFSLSAGAYTCISAQSVLTAWDYLTRKWKHPWAIFGVLIVAAYILVDALSNRNPFEVFSHYLTFSAHNSYNRILIWNFGTAQIWKTPWFGIGVSGTWERPYWMSDSMDNFWLLISVRYGIPAFAFLALAVISICLSIGKARLNQQKLLDYRKALLFSIVGLAIAIFTVHLWNATYVHFIFLLGCGIWFIDEGKKLDLVGAEDKTLQTSNLKVVNYAGR